jgi:serine/threonine-protein kinase
VKTELELNPPPPPPDTSTWPPPQKPKPPNPLEQPASAQPSEPTPGEAVAAGDSETPENSETGDGKDSEKAGSAKTGQPRPGTSKVKPQSVAKDETGKKPGVATRPTGTGTQSSEAKDLETKLKDEPNTTVEQDPDGQAIVVDTSSPQAMRKSGIGLLNLRTVPPAGVYDGQTKLGTTPFRVPLPAGTYRLRLVDPDGNSRLFSAPVELAKEKKYTIRLSDLPMYPE